MARPSLALGAAFAGVTGLLGVLVWLAWPTAPPSLDPAPSVSTANLSPSRPRPAARRPHPREAAPREPREAKAKAKPEKTKAEAEFEPDERAGLREDVREERLGGLSDRLDTYAQEAGLDAQTTEQVRDVMIDTSDRITKELARVDRGEASWDDVRRELRQYRLDQATKVRRILGDDGFDDMVDSMGLERFMGEEPIRGRLD